MGRCWPETFLVTTVTATWGGIPWYPTYQPKVGNQVGWFFKERVLYGTEKGNRKLFLWAWNVMKLAFWIHLYTCVCVRDVILSCVCTSCQERNLRLNVRLPDAALGYWVAILGSPVNPLPLSFTFFVFNNFKNLAVRTSYKPMKYQLYLLF